MSTQYTPMVVAAAKALCKRNADGGGINYDDNWRLYSSEWLADAQAAIDASGAHDLLEALRGWIWARETGASEELAEEYARAALARATGEAA